MSDPLGALLEGATPPHQTSDPSAVAAKEVFRRRLLTTCTQSLIVNPSDDTTTSKPPPPPPPEYAPPSPPRRGTVLGIPGGGKAPAGLVASSDGGRNVTSQLIPSKPSRVSPAKSKRLPKNCKSSQRPKSPQLEPTGPKTAKMSCYTSQAPASHYEAAEAPL